MWHWRKRFEVFFLLTLWLTLKYKDWFKGNRGSSYWHLTLTKKVGVGGILGVSGGQEHIVPVTARDTWDPCSWPCNARLDLYIRCRLFCLCSRWGSRKKWIKVLRSVPSPLVNCLDDLDDLCIYHWLFVLISIIPTERRVRYSNVLSPPP